MCLSKVYLQKQGIYVPCGQCFECKLAHSIEWSNRIALEAMSHEENSFITLTYDEEHLPTNGSLVKSDVQNFLKRLRKLLYPAKVRFFCAGEYGAKGERPHYHLIIFGYNFPDKHYFMTDSKGNPLFRSNMLEMLWKNGFSSIGDVSLRTTLYIAKYLQKLPYDMGEKVPPFATMSLKPGIGASSVSHAMLENECLYIQGKRTNIPRYFMKLLERDFPADAKKLKDKWLDPDKVTWHFNPDTGEVKFYNGAVLPKDYLDNALGRKHIYEKKYGFALDDFGKICYDKGTN